MSVVDTLSDIKRRVGEELQALDGSAALENLRVRVLGKKGELTALLKGMGQLAPEERPRVGAQINEVRQWLTERMDEAQARIRAAERAAALKSETIDVTEPRPLPKVGSEHPITLVMNELIECFTGMGFDVMEGPEVELDHYNFELMNLPKNHPARDAQDTFYMDENIVLRTHTSPMQARAMLTRKPPIRIICPGRVFRNEAISYRAHCIFHQIEGLYIDEGVSFADMKQSLLYFAKEVFGEQAVIRMRPSYFPFTEPSAEVDVSCNLCGGKGCPVCKGTGWLEIMGCGMVDPNVLQANGIDPEKYSGFAFGMGIERIAMLKYGVKDLRLYFENDVRFLHQFDTAL